MPRMPRRRSNHSESSNRGSGGSSREPSVTDVTRGQRPEEIVRNSAEVLDRGGDADFQSGGKMSKLKDFAMNSMSKRAYRQQFDQSMNGRGMSPNDLMMSQMKNTMSDMSAFGAVGEGMKKMSLMDKVVNDVNIVKNGVKAVTSFAKGDMAGMASAAMKVERGLEKNGQDSMVQSVGQMHNAGRLGQIAPGTWNQMGQLDANGSMTSRLGFSPAAAGGNPQLAMAAMNQQFLPGQGIPSGFGKEPESMTKGLVKKAAIGAGIAFAGKELLDHKDGIMDALNKDGDTQSQNLKTAGGGALDLASVIGGKISDVTGIGDAKKSIEDGTEKKFDRGVDKITQLVTGTNATPSQDSPASNDPYAPPKYDEPTR